MADSQRITTKAYVVESQGAPFTLRDVILDALQPDEVLVELKYTGICHTDIVVQHGGMPIGSYPAILGHEGVGIVRQIGSQVKDKSLSEGDAVLLGFRTCRQCSPCLEGRCGACPHMTEYNFVSARRREGAKPIYSFPDGTPVHGQFFGQSSLSKLAIVAQDSVVKCEVDDKSLQYLAPLGCGYSTGAGTVFNALRPKPESTIAILGMGAVGLAALLAAKSMGVGQIIAVDIVDSKLELALSMGATHTINTKQVPDLCSGIRALFPDGVDQIIDTTGVSALMQASMKALGHEGVLAVVGVPRPGDSIQIDALDLLVSCKRVIGVIEGFADSKEIIPQLVKLYRQGNFPVDRISTVYPAERLDQAIEDLKTGKVIKPVLSWDSI
ncbi:conserved hypothetical protein [Uncinocarpus reesii 1704]|uniref:Enoyl reductase (ER) domain-containing protein n=1 Tax=Uncinocarpus reesii (strain UAMH 1704) TaxID=336963 RepID=C4JI64_UNCRE|nr:uncharacterized protein UREG_02810 [Uncinocarpus reesii 1704]EEP77961.1 conserved hypothetical protein [Uncinocarpus reesii 1704]